MNARLAGVMLVASGLGLSFVCILCGFLVPPSFRLMYGLKSLEEVRSFMPPITLLACESSWVIVVLQGCACACAAWGLRRFPEATVRAMVVGLCGEGLIAWGSMFCYCYQGFMGPMCLHHGPEFEVGEFVTFGFGVFPATLGLLVVPLGCALRVGVAVPSRGLTNSAE